MTKKHLCLGLLTLILLLASCGTEPPPTVPPPTAVPAPTATAEAPPTDIAPRQGNVLISEVLPGVFGVDNNLEFIELYNTGLEAVDLNGWKLWYRLADGKEEELVYAWQEPADIPGLGHYLLARQGKDVGNAGDAEFSTSLFEKKGGLALRNAAGEVVDSLVWGQGPTDYVKGSPAPAPEGGASLERKPGGEAGNGTDSGDNAADFFLNATPQPQNSGDPLTPLPEQSLRFRLEAPASIEPGAELALSIEVENPTPDPVRDVRLRLPLPAGFQVLALPAGTAESEGWVEGLLPELAAGERWSGEVLLQGPWTYLSTLLRGAYVEAADLPPRTYGPLLRLEVAGGSIPIATARSLTGQTVTVEGLATMYTDGFYAGSTGTKFYLEDGSGGIQVYCPGGKEIVHIGVGDRVRVTGTIEVYRDSVEIVPATYPDDVEVLDREFAEPQPTPATVSEVSREADLLGRLLLVEGTATRIDEYTYSYEMDLMDDEGNLLLVYVDKLTGLTTEPLDVGQSYRVTGIGELYNGNHRLMPRFQSDLAQIFAPELMLSLHAPNSILPGRTITYSLTAFNHTDAPLTNVRIAAPLPQAGISLASILDGGQREDDTIVWTLPQLGGGGMSATVRYLATVDPKASGQIVAEPASASADQWPQPAQSAARITFVGSGLPIWAIQGSGPRSPYVREQATTAGIVTGVFPELEGFWIQEAPSDEDPTTSAGLFVLSGENEVSVELGDLVQVRGRIRERSGQTLLDLSDAPDAEALTVISSGNELPAAAELDPPQDEEEAQLYYEALEGMLVQVLGPALAVAPTTKYGETALVRPEWGIERVMRGEPSGMLIFVDDGSSATHYDQSTMPYAARTGDTLEDLIGPLAYTYGNYKIEPLQTPSVQSLTEPLPSLAPAGADEISIATFNVENLFDAYDPHPSDPPLPTTRQYKLDLTKTANAIEALGAPTIVGLQEVENLDILKDLVQEAAISAYEYQPFLIEGSDSRGIDVGYLVRGDRASVEGAASYPAPEGLTSRPPLLITVTVHLDSGDQTVYVLNNHFTSMSAGEKPTEPRRTAQAAWNAALVERIRDQDPQAQVVVLGDLNSFYDSPPLDLLRQAGLRHVYEFVAPQRPYSYIFQGVSETLDHILLTPGLYEHLSRVEALHIDADYPPPIPGDPSPQSVSDHDPIVVWLIFE